MKIDFHSHTCLSKNTPFDLNFFQQAAHRAREQGLGAIGMTDHHDTRDYEKIYQVLDERYPYNGHYYLVDGVRYYPGIEVSVREGPHLLVSGSRDDMLTFYDRLRPHLDPETYPTVEEFFAMQAGLDVINIFAHPLRLKHEIDRVPAAFLPHFDALDLNGKDLRRSISEHRQAIERLGQEYHLPVLAGSDTHHFYSFGCVSNAFHQPFETTADLRTLIHAGAYTINIHPDLPQMVETAQVLKRELRAAQKE